jgi:NAD(P)H-dependent flavin oxidoreductase YrpB (nitropropane dioxygenase family)
MLRTALCDALGIDVPILSAGMGSVAGPDLVAAVSEAGGFGVLGVSGASPDGVLARIDRCRAVTSRPFGVNVIIDEVGWAATPEDRELVHSEVLAAIEAHVAAIVLFWGDPAPYVEPAHQNGVLVLAQVGSVAEAEMAAAAGVDAVIVQGVEAGGHVRGTTSIWELLPTAVAAVAPLPVLASGGIGDGDGVSRAITLGAQGVSLGSRFVASEESRAHPAYKQRIVDSVAKDTVYTTDLYDISWPGAPTRTLRNRTFVEWDATGRPPTGKRPGEGSSIGQMRLPSGETIDFMRYGGAGSPLAGFEGDLDYVAMWAGESVEVINDVLPARTIVRRLAEDAAAAHSRRSAVGE